MTFVLCILDGWGVSQEKDNNAVAMGNTPNFDKLISTCPNALLKCSGLEVGLPEGQMGNSEVGHITIGAGRVIYQDLPKINMAIEKGELQSNEVLRKLISSSKRCHVIGLISDGGVHSHIDHIIAVEKILKSNGVKTFVHAITDGRDVSPKSSLNYIDALIKNGVEISSLMGRYYAMDRDKRWERTKLAYDAIVSGVGARFLDAKEYVKSSHEKGETDEFIIPAVKDGYGGFEDGDSIIICNFRADRVRQISQVFVDDKFNEFKRTKAKIAKAVGMTQYLAQLSENMDALFKSEVPKNTLGQVVSLNGLKQLRAAETEKYAHVTYFLNGGREEPFEGEVRAMIPSPKVATYDLQPEMSAQELADSVKSAIASKEYGFICVNFANPDMVGHSGNVAATIKAVETVDNCLGQIMQEVEKIKGQMLVTADHGNAEQMHDPKTNGPMTSHSMNPVPLIYYGKKDIELKNGGLANIAPTILNLMDIKIPKEIDSESLVG